MCDVIEHRLSNKHALWRAEAAERRRGLHMRFAQVSSEAHFAKVVHAVHRPECSFCVENI